MTAPTAPLHLALRVAITSLLFLLEACHPSSGAAAAASCFVRFATPNVPPPGAARDRRSSARVARRGDVPNGPSGGVGDAAEAAATALGAAIGPIPDAEAFGSIILGGGGHAIHDLSSTLLSVESLPSSLGDVLHPLDTVAAAAIGFGALPLADSLFNATAGGSRGAPGVAFRETAAREFARSASAAGLVALAVLLAGPVAELLQYLGIFGAAADVAGEAPDAVDRVLSVAPRVGFVVWSALSARSFKTYLLANLATEHPDDFEELGKMSLYDRALDVIIFGAAAAFVVDATGLEMGPGLMSIFTLGGLGTVALGIASKDVAEQFVGGLLVSAWDAFDEGDEIRLGDGTEGIVAKIGLFETNLRGFDNIVTRIPNSQIVRQRVSNISRIKRCQVKQIIRYPYSQRKKLPSVLDGIKSAIASSCPELIADGTKPFRADPYSFQSDHIEVIVNCHFRGIPPSGDRYMENRRKVLEAIGRAMDENGVDFALPSLVSFSGERSGMNE